MTRTVRTFLASACALLASMAVCPRHAAAQLTDAGADSAATDAATSSDAAPDDGGSDSGASMAITSFPGTAMSQKPSPPMDVMCG